MSGVKFFQIQEKSVYPMKISLNVSGSYKNIVKNLYSPLNMFTFWKKKHPTNCPILDEKCKIPNTVKEPFYFEILTTDLQQV